MTIDAGPEAVSVTDAAGGPGAGPPERPRSARRERLAALGIAVLTVAAAVVAALAVTGRLGPAPCSADLPGACVRVLFVGNSYTSVNDLPATFRALAASGGHRVETGMVAPGGATLADHVQSSDVIDALAASRWDLVVLQEQSQIPAVDAAREQQMYPAARALAVRAEASGARPVLFETWAQRAGWPEQGLPTYGAMQAQVDVAYRTLAGQLNGVLVPAGEAWLSVRASDPVLDLWQADGSHPSAAGTYLAACVFYAAVFRASPVGLTEMAGLPAETARLLQAAAAAVVLGGPSR